MEDFAELIESIRRERVTLFLGSGFSRKAGAPMAAAIVDNLYESLPLEVQESCKEHKQLDTISEEYEQVYGRDALLEKLEKVMNFVPTDTSDHSALTKVPHFHHIITTNYDSLIEDSYGNNNCFVVRTTEDCADMPKDKTVVYKIHGDFHAKSNIIITKQDYTDFFSENKEPLLWKYLESHILTNDILFIGYSLDDSNIFSIIKEIRRKLDGNKRRFFFISPGLLPHKIERLARTKVTYYNSKAENLFPILFEVLDKKIKSDYQKRRISLDTFSRYCQLHHLQPVVKEGFVQNEIVKFESTEQTELKVSISGINKDIAEAIQSQDTYRFNSFLPNTYIPALKLTHDMMSDINISLNGLTVSEYDDCHQLLISPRVEIIKTSMRIPSRNINEKATLQKFKANVNQVCMLLETEAYVLKIILSFLPNRIINYTCNIKSKDGIKNISEAIKWMSLPIALWNKEEVIFKYIKHIPLKFPNSNLNELHIFQNTLRYFENIKEIENIYDVDFESVSAYSYESLQMSELLIHSYYEHNIREKMRNSECTADIGEEQEGMWDFVKVGSNNCSLAITQNAMDTIEFNGLQFKLKNKHTIIPSCQILDVLKNGDKVSQIKFRITSEFVYIKYTNKDLSEFQEFSQFQRVC